jgi:hypothetical protein
MMKKITRRSLLSGFAMASARFLFPFRLYTAERGLQGPLDKISDRFALVGPSSVGINGFLGERCRKNARARLLAKDEDELLSGFRSRPGRQAWVGEHAGKWLHAATLAYAYTKDAELKTKLDRVAAGLIATQQEDGYLGTYADGAHWAMGKDEKWDVWVHKYDLIGLVTYSTYTGNQAAIEAAKKIGDLLIKTFGRDATLDLNERGTHAGMASGSVLEPMLLLYRATNEEKYLDFARFIAERWEEEKGPKIIGSLTSQRSVKLTANAKAYEMLSCLVGLCELYRATGEAKYLIPAGNAWNDIVANQLLVTGSGSSREHWTENKLFPSEAKDEIAETCVTVSWIQLNQQLLRLTGEAKYADELEKSVYNHLAAAQRPDGAAWAYFTALDGKKPYKTEQNCCTSSGPRGWAMLPSLAYMSSDDGIVVNFFAPGTATFQPKGKTVVVKQETNYPLDGRVAITVTVPEPMKFALRVRVPAWSGLNGLKSNPGEYWLLRQTWSKTQTITLDLAMPVRLLSGAGKVAIARGPRVLAVDWLYNPDLGPLSAYALATDKPQLKISATYRDPDGLPVYETDAVALQDTEKHKAGERVTLRLVPFASAGAHGHEYMVWLPRANDRS